VHNYHSSLVEGHLNGFTGSSLLSGIDVGLKVLLSSWAIAKGRGSSCLLVFLPCRRGGVIGEERKKGD